MSDPLRQEFNDGDYERPNQPWDCGHACEGVRCLLGPTLHGGCQADFECTPLEKDGRWICNRSASRGGKCEKGPSDGACGREIPICSPVASLRRRRSRFVSWCCTLAAGLILLTLSAPWRYHVIKPGNLSNAHRQILNDIETANRCIACHQETMTTGRDDGNALAMMRIDPEASQPERCLVCHHDEIGTPATALLPHGLAQVDLQSRTRAIHERLGVAPRSIGLVGLRDGKVACAACHREHHGAAHDLTSVANHQCAECHQENFRSFATDHPEFGAWPYDREKPIVFNHATHQARYYPQEKQTFDCQSCHDATGRGDIMGGARYASCQTCHESKIQQSLSSGIPLITLPMLDLQALKSSGFSVGDWPEMASGDFDGALPPLTRVLLSNDRSVLAAMEQFEKDFVFSDVDPDNRDDVEAASKIAWGIKRLIYELSLQGPSAIQKRLTQILDTEINKQQIADLLGQMPRESATALQRTWFPNLEKEIQQHDAGESLPLTDQGIALTGQLNIPDGATLNALGWYRDDETLSFQFHPRGHADPFLVAWLEHIGMSRKKTTSDALSVAFDQLTRPTSAGLCVTCHRIEQWTTPPLKNAPPPNGSPAMAAAETGLPRSADRRDRSQVASRSFTHFEHRPHLVLPQLSDCSACHQIQTQNVAQSETIVTSGTADPNQPLSQPVHHRSGFQSMQKHICASCHTPKLAGDRCTTCHHYHVGFGFSNPSPVQPDQPQP